MRLISCCFKLCETYSRELDGFSLCGSHCVSQINAGEEGFSGGVFTSVCVLVKSDISHSEAATTKNFSPTQQIIRNSTSWPLHNWVIELLTTTPPSDVPAQDWANSTYLRGIQMHSRVRVEVILNSSLCRGAAIWPDHPHGFGLWWKRRRRRANIWQTSFRSCWNICMQTQWQVWTQIVKQIHETNFVCLCAYLLGGQVSISIFFIML